MAAAVEEGWTLQLPGNSHNSVGFPKSIREVVLMGALHCDQVKDALKAGAISLAEVASLMSKFHLLGQSEGSTTLVELLSDEDVRRFFVAAGGAPQLTLGLGRSSERAASVEDFVVARERQKAEETVKLNVSGQLYEVHRMTAERIPLVAAMLRFTREKEEEKPIFVDASPKAFDVLLEIARGRKRSYLDTLEPSLKVLVEAYAEYAGMTVTSVMGFDFKLSATHPNNASARNAFAYLSEQETMYTTGVRQQWNTVFGSSLLPSSGQSYWEVEVTTLGQISADFVVGVTTSAFATPHAILDSGNQGAGLGFINQVVTMRSNGQSGSALTESFPIFQGTRIGVFVDADRGSLMFFHNGTFKCSHSASFKGQSLLPAFSVLADTALTIKTGLVDKKVSQLLGLRHGQQPHQEGYLSGREARTTPQERASQALVGGGRNRDLPDFSEEDEEFWGGTWVNKEGWSKSDIILDFQRQLCSVGNWFTSASLVSRHLADDVQEELRGTALYGCNRYACGRSMESHKVLVVYQPYPVVGCGFLSDAGTNTLGEFTGCAQEWPGEWPGPKGARCSTPDDCGVRTAGGEFGEEAKRGVWRVDQWLCGKGKFLSPLALSFSGRFDPYSAGAQRFVEEIGQAGERIHTMGYNEVMVQDGAVPAKRFSLTQLRLWQCRTNGVRAFARVQPVPEVVDEKTRHVENCRYEVFKKMRDAYDMACGRSVPTPILFFDLTAGEKPFSAPEINELFPCRDPCDLPEKK
ncbi:unnamed protein product [Durusdinium trenchii]|uniref:B30.2/SPRY domain-containing protein n=1 Tax=Durusdinium trenchii TaxID=1381693 RepID=A0ABP0QTH7_9DINO